VLITAGVLVLLFVVYQLWGTGIQEARAQSSLEDEFEEFLSEAGTAAAEGTTTPTTAPAETTVPPTPPDGDAVAHLVIPAIGVDKIIVEGVSVADLKRGPGHYPGSPLPGQPGNAAIAGHRTTYGAPFYRLDELDAGDEIEIETLTGSYTYRVRELLVVAPTAVEVVRNTPNAQLTLTTCNPRFSARQRLVAVADLVEEVSDRPLRPGRIGAIDRPPRLAVDDGLEEGLQGDPAGRGITVAWGVAVAAVGLAWWWVFRRWRLPATWVAGALPFLAVLTVFYYHLERLLPAGY
jgi:sortase A